MKYALYARVSTDKQEREQTIESQLEALRTYAVEKGYEVDERHVYVEEFPGDRLDRPKLDALRDRARDGEFEAVLVSCPDRLARRFAYQEIVIEEIERSGCKVEFLERPISDNPEDRLLQQFQGILAEYERYKILERTRRGRLYKARQGVFVIPHAPYGYRHVPKRDGIPAHLEIDPQEAEAVRHIFDWCVNGQLSTVKIAERLRTSGWKTRHGGQWRGNTVGNILRSEAYTGKRYYNKTKAVEPKRRRNRSGYVRILKSSHAARPREEWIEQTVPRIIDEEMYRRAREQLKTNALRAFRNLHGKHRYLLRSLVRCGACGRARSGRTTYTDGREYTYYDCTSTLVRPRVDRCCKSPGVRAEELHRLVWDEVKKLLRNPEAILRYFHEQHGKEVGTTFDLARRKLSELERSLAVLKREKGRLVDAYQGQVIELEELRERRSAIEQRRKELRADIKRVEQELGRLQRQGSIREGISLLTKKLAGSLEELSFEEKQKIIQLLVEEIRVHAGHVEIHYIMPLSGNLHLQSRSLSIVSCQEKRGMGRMDKGGTSPGCPSPSSGLHRSQDAAFVFSLQAKASQFAMSLCCTLTCEIPAHSDRA